jgi:hypothetical protein
MTNITPMGPLVDPGSDHLVLRPFRSSQTFRNLVQHPEGVFHVTDDVFLIARAAVDRLQPLPELLPASKIRGKALRNACRRLEFIVDSVDEHSERASFGARVVHVEHVRDFFGFNRAKHAVLEAAILATRTEFIALDHIEEEFSRLQTIVMKTGGPSEIEAFDFLRGYIAEVRARSTSTPVCRADQ